jgi:hypothetical protein
VRLTKEWRVLGFRACTEWHWQARISGVLVDYWPSKGKWSWGGQIETGAADKLLDRIEGKAVQKSDITSKGDRLGYVIAAPFFLVGMVYHLAMEGFFMGVLMAGKYEEWLP